MKHFLCSLLLIPLLSVANIAYAQAAAPTVTITWIDKSDNEAGFKVERKLGTTGDFAQVGTVAANVATYLDPNLAFGVAYCYRVRAYNAAGDSGFTNEACVTTKPNPLPNSPTGLSATTQ